MATVEKSTPIAAQLERAWEALIDFESRPKYAPRVKEASLLDKGPLREGSRIALKIDRDRFTATVVECKPSQRLGLLVKGPGFRVNHVYELQPDPQGANLTLSAHYAGVIGSLAGRFMRGSVERDLTGELTAIKQAAEAKR